MTTDPLSRGADVDLGDEPTNEGVAGWAQVSFAINSILRLSTPVFLRLDVDDHEPLFIDFRHNAYVWSTPIADFPPHPRSVRFETDAAAPDAPPLFKLPGENLNSLLWVLGLNAADGKAAPWLRPGERYRLAQWPNLARHLHDMNQMHMLAILGNGYFSATELAKMAGVREEDAHNLVNALSLLRLLRVSEVVPELVIEQAPEEINAPGLFARLRARLGR